MCNKIISYMYILNYLILMNLNWKEKKSKAFFTHPLSFSFSILSFYGRSVKLLRSMLIISPPSMFSHNFEKFLHFFISE
jgi:hypothetical protein